MKAAIIFNSKLSIKYSSKENSKELPKEKNSFLFLTQNKSKNYWVSQIASLYYFIIIFILERKKNKTTLIN